MKFAEVEERATLRSSLHNVDRADEYSRSVAGVQVEAVRCGSGIGPNRVVTVQDEHLTFTSSEIGIPLRTRTTIADDQVVIGCVHDAPTASRWCEFDLGPGTVVAYGPGAEHTGISRPGLRFSFMTVPAERLTELADRIHSPIAMPSHGEVHRFPTSPADREFVSSMRALAAVANNGRGSLKGALDAALVAAVHTLTGTNREVNTNPTRRIDCRHLVHQCIDYADALGRIPSISELCLTAHVSERTLRKAFAEEYDLPPSRFFRDWALTRARQRLGEADRDRHTVTDIASELGFNHLGRFSLYYRTHYGEPPSTTLQTTFESS